MISSDPSKKQRYRPINLEDFTTTRGLNFKNNIIPTLKDAGKHR